MIKCIGVLIYDRTKDKFLLQQRSKKSSYALTWGVWGGKLNENESFVDGLKRELKEELGSVPNIFKMFPIDIFHTPDQNFVYLSYLVIVDNYDDFEINEETNDYVWMDFEHIDKMNLHPGFLKSFEKKKNQIFNIKQKYKGS